MPWADERNKTHPRWFTLKNNDSHCSEHSRDTGHKPDVRERHLCREDKEPPRKIADAISRGNPVPLLKETGGQNISKLYDILQVSIAPRIARPKDGSQWLSGECRIGLAQGAARGSRAGADPGKEKRTTTTNKKTKQKEERKRGKGGEKREKVKEKEEEENGKLGIPIIGRKQDKFEKARVKLNRKRTPKTFVSGPEILELKSIQNKSIN